MCVGGIIEGGLKLWPPPAKSFWRWWAGLRLSLVFTSAPRPKLKITKDRKYCVNSLFLHIYDLPICQKYRKQDRAELGQAQLILGLDFILIFCRFGFCRFGFVELI